MFARFSLCVRARVIAHAKTGFDKAHYFVVPPGATSVL